MNNKIKQIEQVLEKSSTFSGYDLPVYSEEEVVEILKVNLVKSQDFIKIVDKAGSH